MKITSIVRFGVAALAIGAFFGVRLPVKADQLVWVRAQQLDYFRARGLMPPGSYSQRLKLQKRAHSTSALQRRIPESKTVLMWSPVFSVFFGG